MNLKWLFKDMKFQFRFCFLIDWKWLLFYGVSPVSWSSKNIVTHSENLKKILKRAIFWGSSKGIFKLK